jgi:AcrR family transcriptional regulator
MPESPPESPPETPPESPGGGERTRSRLIELAVRRFGSAGYREASIAAVARDAGLTAAAVSPYFRTMRDLVVAALTSDIDALLQASIDEGARSPRPWLTTLRHLEEHLADHPLAMRALDGEPAELAIDVFELEPVRAFHERLRDQIALAQQLGLARPDVDATVMALGIETIAVALLGTVGRRGVGADPDRRRAVAAILLTALLPEPD